MGLCQPEDSYGRCPACGCEVVLITTKGLICAACGYLREAFMQETGFWYPDESRSHCPVCGSTDITTRKDGELVCRGCGLPVEEM